MPSKRSVLLAFDKFRGSADNGQLTAAATAAAERLGWDVKSVALADGGEGSLDALGGANRTAEVTDPLGRTVEAGWRLEGRTAFIEMSAASGLALVGGAERNQPMEASTVGTGQLISKAIEVGARDIYVFLGGSATTDGGLGALRAMPPPARLKEINLVVACDVETLFVDAAAEFGPQKGASAAQVKMLSRRLERLQQIYFDDYGVDLRDMAGGGAAGGLAGGLMAVGADTVAGFELLADHVGLDELLPEVDLCITGEGKLDTTSFKGKVVGGVHRWAGELDVPTVAIVGVVGDGVEVPNGLQVRSLTDEYGSEAAFADTLRLVEELAELVLSKAEAG